MSAHPPDYRRVAAVLVGIGLRLISVRRTEEDDGRAGAASDTGRLSAGEAQPGTG
jgi:hypothetical protein